jgi:hypothetical protein
MLVAVVSKELGVGEPIHESCNGWITNELTSCNCVDDTSFGCLDYA